MTEQELRALVRHAIARHAGPTPRIVGRVLQDPPNRSTPDHASHAMFVVPAGADGDGPCLIEPSVPCSHCGYCRSLGH